MATLIIPRANRREQAMFDKLGITLIDSLTLEAFEQLAADFLSTHNVLHLATFRAERIRSTALEYFSHGLQVHVLSEGGVKILNIKAQPRVCYSIAEPYDPRAGILGARGMQVWGRAEVFKKMDNPLRAAEIFTCYPHADTIAQQGIQDSFDQVNFNIITIVPDMIRYLDLKSGFRNVTWKRDPAGAAL